jgi:hypothetical protein
LPQVRTSRSGPCHAYGKHLHRLPPLRNCPQNCPCQRPKSSFRSQQQPSGTIEEVTETRGFARKIEDVREADFRLANRFTPQVARAADEVQTMVFQDRFQNLRIERGLCPRRPTSLDNGPACNSVKAPRQRGHSRQGWHCRICNLQNLKDRHEFESLSLRHR